MLAWGYQAWCGTPELLYLQLSLVGAFHCSWFSTSWLTTRKRWENTASETWGSTVYLCWSTSVKTHPTLRERSLLTLPAKVKVAMCTTEVDTLNLSQAGTHTQGARDLEHAKLAIVRTQALWFGNLLEADKVHCASGKKGAQASSSVVYMQKKNFACLSSTVVGNGRQPPWVACLDDAVFWKCAYNYICIYAKLILLLWDSIGTLLHYEVMIKEHMHTYSTSNAWLIQMYSVYVLVCVCMHNLCIYVPVYVWCWPSHTLYIYSEWARSTTKVIR